MQISPPTGPRLHAACTSAVETARAAVMTLIAPAVCAAAPSACMCGPLPPIKPRRPRGKPPSPASSKRRLNVRSPPASRAPRGSIVSRFGAASEREPFEVDLRALLSPIDQRDENPPPPRRAPTATMSLHTSTAPPLSLARLF